MAKTASTFPKSPIRHLDIFVLISPLRSETGDDNAARQLPDLSITIWVDPSSTDVICLRGALSKTGQLTWLECFDKVAE